MRACTVCGRETEQDPCPRCMELAAAVAQHFDPVLASEIRLNVPFPAEHGPSLLAFYWLVRVAGTPTRRVSRRRKRPNST